MRDQPLSPADRAHRRLPPLVAVAHGSRDPRAATTVEELLDGVRQRSPFPVSACYLDHVPPTLGQALDDPATGTGTAVVLPLLLTAAYHSKTDIPRALAAVPRHRRRVRYGGTLGPDPLLSSALERRLTEAGVSVDDPDTAVVLVSAGSSDPAANRTVQAMARRWGRRCGRTVVAAYASAARPTPAEAVRALYSSGVARVAVTSYFLAPGYFADRVRTESLNAGAVAVSPVLGAAPELTELVLRRYTEALDAGRRTAEAGTGTRATRRTTKMITLGDLHRRQAART